jgi:lipopolysaccharide biosynthesis glycosyltransferase
MIASIYIGYDPREDAAYRVAKSSLERRSSIATHIRPIKLEKMGKHGFDRPLERKDGKMWCPISRAPVATEFAITRFMVPFLQSQGLALFMDCDMLIQEDIANLFAEADPQYAVQVVQHRQSSGVDTKMDGQVQTYYARKNWSSVVLWNLDHPAHERLTLDMVNTLPGRDLHAFCWLEDHEIGALTHKWNQLVGVTDVFPNIGILHYTLGSPALAGWAGGPYDDLWNHEKPE